MGELRILSLRQQMQDKLGVHFNLAKFHQALLNQGALPFRPSICGYPIGLIRNSKCQIIFCKAVLFIGRTVRGELALCAFRHPYFMPNYYCKVRSFAFCAQGRKTGCG